MGALHVHVELIGSARQALKVRSTAVSMCDPLRRFLRRERALVLGFGAANPK